MSAARFVTALTAMAKLADELTDVLGAVIVGPPSRAVVRVEVERDVSPVNIVLTRRSPEDRARYIRAAAARGSVTAAIAEAMLEQLDDPPCPGLVPCPTCGTEQSPRDGHMAVHFATRAATRPCVGSWPVKVAAKGRAA